MPVTARLALACLALASLAPTASRGQETPTAATRAAFQKLLDRPRVPLDVKAGPTTLEPADGLTVERLTFASERKPDGSAERVPVLIVRPSKAGGKRPVVIALHGTGGTKDGMRSWLDELARAGMIGVAIDARYHGDRVPGVKGASAYVEAITRAWRSQPGAPQEHPFYYDTCWDLWRTLDYLATRDDVDPARVAMFGISMGGIETWLAASADDRVAVVVPAIGVQSFRWSLEHEAWGGRAATIRGAHEAAAHDLGAERVDARVCRALWGKVIPGILDEYDCPNMLRLCAPRPLLIVNGELDPNCPLGGAKVAFGPADAPYAQAGAGDRLKVMVAPGVAHAVTDEQHRAIVAWLTRWLKP